MIKVNKAINLNQLDTELNNLGLIATLDDSGQVIEVGLSENNTATEAELQAAIAAHVAEPTEQEITLLNRTQGRAKLKELGFTDEQISALLNI